jgi:hypothetical protein
VETMFARIQGYAWQRNSRCYESARGHMGARGGFCCLPKGRHRDLEQVAGGYSLHAVGWLACQVHGERSTVYGGMWPCARR